MLDRSKAFQSCHSAEFLERHSGYVCAFLLIATFLIGIGQSAHKLFSYDEYVTYKIASLPRVQDVWNFFAEGLDTTGPFAAVVAHTTRWIPASPEISMRIPFAIAFLGVGLGTFAFLRRRYPAGFALTAFLIPLEIPSASYHLTDARAYAFLLGGTGMAVFFWQTAALHKIRPWSVVGLWFMLAIAMCAHFFAVFLIFPFALAQAVRDYGEKKVDVPVWGAILSYPLAWLPFLPGQLQAHKNYATHFWSKPQPDNIMDAYQFSITNSWTLIFVLAVFLVGVALYQARNGGRMQTGQSTGLTNAEWVLAVTLFLLPLYAWLAALLLGAYQIKYVLAFCIGLVIVLIAGIAELARRNPSTGVIFFIVLLTLTLGDDKGAKLGDGVATLFDADSVHERLESGVMGTWWAKEVRKSTLPVVTDNDTYRLLDLYGSSELPSRVYGLTDSAEAEKYERSMTDQTNLKLFSKKLPIQTMDVEEFTEKHPHFLLLAQRQHNHYEWQPEYFLQRQKTKHDVSITLLSIDNESSKIIYEVRRQNTPLGSAD